MDDWFFSFVIFVIAFFLYFHIQNQYKTSDVLEIYEYDYVDSKSLQDTCGLKQPVLFHMPDHGITTKELPAITTSVFVKDIREYYQQDTATVEPIILKTTSATGLLSSDTRSSYFSQNNVIQTENTDKFEQLDQKLQPFLNVKTYYDVMFGSRKAYTPMTYHMYSQRFFVVEGETSNCGIRIKMCPWKNTPRLHQRKDYENFEFWSTMNMFRGDEDKFKILDFVVNPGYILYIPPYWWYSFQFLDVSTYVTSVSYSTAINTLANTKEYALHLYHQPNLQSKIMQEVIPDIEDEEEDTNDPSDHDLDDPDPVGKLDSTKPIETVGETETNKQENQDVSLQLIEELKSH